MPYLDHYTAVRRKRLAKAETVHRILRGERRKHVVSTLMDGATDWRSNPFEREASYRAGLRVGFIATGADWTRADVEAQALVREVFSRLDVERPTWEEGQPGYTQPAENCAWCAKPLPEEDVSSGRRGRFCDENCARSAIARRDFESGYRSSAIGSDAYRLITREKRPTITCAHCGIGFKPWSRNCKDQLYCSNLCRSKTRINVPERDCKTCGRSFRPRQNSAKGLFCSTACHHAQDLPKVTCMCCDKVFQPRKPFAIFCSPNCNKKAYKMRQRLKGKEKPSNVIYLTAEIFDAWFKVAA